MDLQASAPIRGPQKTQTIITTVTTTVETLYEQAVMQTFHIKTPSLSVRTRPKMLLLRGKTCRPGQRKTGLSLGGNPHKRTCPR